MPFRIFAVGIVNTGWSRPLAKSRTSGNQSVLVLGKRYHLRHNLQKTCFVLTRYTMHVNLDILHPHFPKYEKERWQIPKTRFANIISAFCEFRFRHLQNQKTNIRKYLTTPFAQFKNNRLTILISVSSKSQKIKMKHHAVMKPSFLVRFCLTISSESHTRHQLDKRPDEVRLRLSHRRAHRPQTYTSVK